MAAGGMVMEVLGEGRGGPHPGAEHASERALEDMQDTVCPVVRVVVGLLSRCSEKFESHA